MMKKMWLALVCFSVLLAGCARGSAGIACPFGPDELLPQEEGVLFQIDNQACTSICRVYLASPTCEEWGYDLLQEGVVNHGETLSMWVPPGIYALQIEECTQNGFEMEDVDLNAEAAWVYGQEGVESGAACPASLTVVNGSSAAVCHMWIAGPESESFGYNWLGEGEIPAGGTRTFPVPPGTYDVKAEDCAFNILRLELGKPIYDPQVWQIP